MEKLGAVKDGRTDGRLIREKKKAYRNRSRHWRPPLYLVGEREARGGVERKPLTAGLLVLPWRLSLH